MGSHFFHRWRTSKEPCGSPLPERHDEADTPAAAPVLCYDPSPRGDGGAGEAGGESACCPAQPVQGTETSETTTETPETTVGEDGTLLIPPLVVEGENITFEPKPADVSYGLHGEIPDTAIDGWSTPFFGMRAASTRGLAHRFYGTPRQDAYRVALTDDGRYLCIAVADGVSSARYAHRAAGFAVKYALMWLSAKLSAPETDVASLDWLTLIQGVSYQLLEMEKEAAASAPATNGADEPRKSCFATTLAVAVCSVREEDGYLSVTGVTVGDSPVLSIGEDGVLLVSGRKAADGTMATSKVNALPAVPTDVAVPFSYELPPDRVLFMTSDGVSDALGEGGGPLTRYLQRGLLGAEKLTLLEFARLVDFSKSTYDDDRTAVAVWSACPPHDNK